HMIHPHLKNAVTIPQNWPHKSEQYLVKTAEKTLAFATTKKVFEDQAAQDLRKAGFKVIRFPGRFDIFPGGEPHLQPITNFFNMISLTTPKDQRIVIALGCPAESGLGLNLQEHFIKMLQAGGVKCEVVFLNYEQTQLSLRTNGGISCRTKNIGLLL